MKWQFLQVLLVLAATPVAGTDTPKPESVFIIDVPSERRDYGSNIGNIKVRIFRWAFRGVDLSRHVYVCPSLAHRLSRLDALYISERLWQASKQHLARPLS